MNENGSNGSGAGNTITARVAPSKYWCFTLHYDDVDPMDQLETVFKSFQIDYILGREICPKTGRKHIQGYIESNDKIRPIEKLKLSKEIHWEKRKGTKEQNITYCSKEGDFSTSWKLKKKVLDPLEGRELYPWQKEVYEIISKKPDDRTIHWYYETDGKTGKSSFAKHLAMKRDAYYVTGKSADIKFALQKQLVDKDIEIVIFDFTRSVEGFVSYQAIEEVKNGIFFSTKFESGMVIFNPPHIICLANFEPEKHKLSLDRWHIVEIKNH